MTRALPRPANGADLALSHETARYETGAVLALTMPEPDAVEQAGALSSVAAAAGDELANLLFATEEDLEQLASDALAARSAAATRLIWARACTIRHRACELRAAATEPGPEDTERHTHLGAWWPAVEDRIHALHQDHVTISAHIPPDLPAVCIKPHQLSQIVLNLVSNAAHAIADRAAGNSGGRVQWDGPARGEVMISARRSGDGRSVELAVADDGVGMAPPVLSRACEPFFTTRPEWGALGMGLTVAQRLLHPVGGCIRLSSAIGAGTTVTIKLPMS